MTRPDLGAHMGDPIVRTNVAITNAGDGLSAALAIDPQVIGKDETVYVVLRCALKDHKLAWVDDTDADIEGWVLTNRLRAGLATIVDADLVSDLLDAQQRKLDEAAGVVRIPFQDDDETAETGGEALRSDGELESHVAAVAERKKKKKNEADLVSIEEVSDADRSSEAG